ncbi:hypothetical protein ACFLVB_03985, partial [Chloroflexota bacterium]
MAQQLTMPDDEQERRAKAIKALSLGLLGMMMIAEILTIVLWAINSSYPAVPITIVLIVVMLVSVMAYWLVKVGRVRLAGSLFVIGLLLESAIITPMFGGFAGPMAITYLFSILVAGIVIGARAGYLVATLAVALYLAMIPVEQAGILPYILEPAAPAPVIHSVTVAVRAIFFYLVAFLSWFASSRLNQ